MNKRFELGRVVMTQGIAAAIEDSAEFSKETHTALNRYIACDWGDTHPEDKPLNDRAVENGDTRILAKYNTSKGAIFIITEADRTSTCILFASEY